MYELRAVCKTENTSEERVKGTQIEEEIERERTAVAVVIIFVAFSVFVLVVVVVLVVYCPCQFGQLAVVLVPRRADKSNDNVLQIKITMPSALAFAVAACLASKRRHWAPKKGHSPGLSHNEMAFCSHKTK